MLARFWAGIGALFVCTAAAALLAIAVAPAALPSWTPTVVGSGSMRPAIGVGDVVVLRSPGEQALAPPAVVLIDRSGGDPSAGPPPLLHRVVAYDPARGYTTKGDANDEADSDPVAPDRVLGVGRLLVPYVGWPALWIERGQWPLLAAAIAAGVLTVRLARYGWDSRYDPWAPRPARPAGPARPAPPAGPTHATRPAGPARPDGPAPTAGPAGPTRPPGPDRTAVPGRSRRWPTTLLVLALVALMAAGWLGPGSSRSAFSDTTGNTGNRMAADTLAPVTSLAATVRCAPGTAPTFIASVEGSLSGSRMRLRLPSVQAGDLLVAQVSDENGSIARPAGFTRILSGPNDGVGAVVVDQRIATAADQGRPTYEWTVTSRNRVTGWLMVFRGAAVLTSSGEKAETGGRPGFGSGEIVAPSVRAGRANSMLVVLVAVRYGPAPPMQGAPDTPSGMTQRYSGNGGNNDFQVAAFTQIQTRTGETGTRRSTAGPGAMTTTAQSLLIRPLARAELDLTWSASASTYATGHEVLRNGVRQATLTPRTVTLWEDTAPPTGTPTYEVRATAGTWRSTPASVRPDVSC